MSSSLSSSKLAQGPIATITIRPCWAVYRIHRNLICHYSAYFERALVMKHADKVTLNKHVDSSNMDLIVDWLYTGKLNIRKDSWNFPLGMLGALVSRSLKPTRGEVIAITIGPDKTIFRIHKDILCKKSEYFRTAYDGRWKESEQRVTLEDVEVGLFQLFVHWLYKEDLALDDAGLLTIADEDAGGSAGDDAEARDDHVECGWVLLKACAFCEPVPRPRFRNAQCADCSRREDPVW
ncbi:hypothetical protein G6011_08549 [Alternaria panax]|uniref:BTB domain-containing protein n=1 Tax=Alternaria panax TaxID=48097 RepID=A0AAD4FIY5_9PLEO|nr:hypothetical protein G6011_08549 [Alternaria panax]